MAVVPGNPIAITGPGVYPIPYPGGGSQPTGSSHQWTQIKLENASPFPLTFVLGGTPVHSLPAGIADVFPLTLGPSGPTAPPTAGVDAPAQPLTVIAGAAQQPPAQTAGTLRPSFGQYGDQFPGVYPVSLPGNLFAASLAVSAGQVLLPLSGFPIPPPGAGPGTSPVINVQNMAELLIEASSTTGSPASNWQVLWFADPAGTISVGYRYEWNVISPALHLVPIAPQGPYCQVTAQAVSAGSPQTARVSIIGFPQAVDRGAMIPPSVVFSVQNVTVAANTLVPPQLTSLYSPGRYTIMCLTDQYAVFRIESLTTLGTWQTVWQANTADILNGGAPTAPGAGSITQELILSGDDYQVTIGNLSATPAHLSMTITGPLS